MTVQADILDAAAERDDPVLVRAFRSAATVGLIAVIVGLPITIVGGYLSSYPQFRTYFLAIGLGGFFAPGVLAITGGVLIRQRRAVGLWLAVPSLIWGAVVGAALTGVQFSLDPVSPMPVVITGVGTLAAAAAAWNAWSARGHLDGGRRGFAI